MYEGERSRGRVALAGRSRWRRVSAPIHELKVGVDLLSKPYARVWIRAVQLSQGCRLGRWKRPPSVLASAFEEDSADAERHRKPEKYPPAGFNADPTADAAGCPLRVVSNR